MAGNRIKNDKSIALTSSFAVCARRFDDRTRGRSSVLGVTKGVEEILAAQDHGATASLAPRGRRQQSPAMPAGKLRAGGT